MGHRLVTDARSWADAVGSGATELLVLPPGFQPGALSPDELAGRLAAPNPGVVYADGEDWLPDWSPVLLRHRDYVTGPLLVRGVALAPGGLVDGPGWHHDLVLRVAEAGLPVQHRRERLGSGGRPHTSAAAVRAHLSRLGLAADVTDRQPGLLSVRRHPSPGRVSLVVPTRGTVATVGGRPRRLVTELVREVESQRYEIDHDWVVVVDADTQDEYVPELRAELGDRLTVVEYDRPFNFSEKVNLGVLATDAELVAVLNDDLAVVTPTWLDHLAALAQEPGVGAVGCVLLYEDGRVQHGGHEFVATGGAHAVRHVLRGRPVDAGGCLAYDREVSGVTGACLVQRRDVWAAVGGWSELFPRNYNDVDLCLKVSALGLRTVVSGEVVLRHFEGRTRSQEVPPDERALLGRRWEHRLAYEGYCRPEEAAPVEG